MRNLLATALLTALLAAPAAADTTGAAFLRLGAGARASAMGGAGTALSEDATALYWNPSLLGLVPRAEGAFSHAEQFGAARYQTVHAAVPVEALKGTFGAGLTYLRQETLERVTAAGNSGGSFTPSSLALSAGYGAVVPLSSARVGLGAAGKLVRETLDDATASAYAADLGAWAEHESAPRWRAAAAVRHLGSQEKFLRESEDLPTEVAVALARTRKGDYGLSSTVEVVAPLHGTMGARFGGEWASALSLDITGFARAGYDTVAARNLGAFAGLTLGGGARFGTLDWDASYQNAGELGHTFKLSARWCFGPQRPLR